jgi:N-acetyl-alpha-D-muramate 1-phosphate uridylyltransferase
MTPDTIMIFAAGRGTRMRELTDARPKPLIPVLGKPLIDHALDLADGAGIARKVVNSHYLGHMIANHLRGRDDVALSPEVGEALETGGGLKHALPLISRDAVFTLNPDVVWLGANPLRKLAAAWRPDRMEALLTLIPVERAAGHKYRGDFVLDANGRIKRFKGNGQAYVFTGAQIVQTAPLNDINEARFSFNLLWDRLIAKSQLFGCIYNGRWADVGSPEGLVLATEMLKNERDV